MRQFQFHFLALLGLLVLPTVLFAEQPWRQPMPEIRSDGVRLFFCGDKWCGVYADRVQGILTVPRDSVNLPPVLQPATAVSVLGRTYSFSGPTLTQNREGQPDTTFDPGLPTVEALRYLAQAAQAAGATAASPLETIEQITGTKTLVAFTLKLRDTNNQTTTSGIGWYDPNTGNFARIYSPALIGYRPDWIGCVGDTVHALYSSLATATENKWIMFCNGNLIDYQWQRCGIPGSQILRMGIYKGQLALATDHAIAMRYDDGQQKVWATDAVASRKSVMTYFATRTADGKNMKADAQFQSLVPGRAMQLMAIHGDWAEVAVPSGIEAVVDSIVWVANFTRVSNTNWFCDEPCFFTVRIPTKGTYREMELTNSPISLLEYANGEARVGIISGWARRAELSPVLVPVH